MYRFEVVFIVRYCICNWTGWYNSKSRSLKTYKKNIFNHYGSINIILLNLQTHPIEYRPLWHKWHSLPRPRAAENRKSPLSIIDVDVFPLCSSSFQKYQSLIIRHKSVPSTTVYKSEQSPHDCPLGWQIFWKMVRTEKMRTPQLQSFSVWLTEWQMLV